MSSRYSQDILKRAPSHILEEINSPLKETLESFIEEAFGKNWREKAQFGEVRTGGEDKYFRGLKAPRRALRKGNTTIALEYFIRDKTKEQVLNIQIQVNGKISNLSRKGKVIPSCTQYSFNGIEIKKEFEEFIVNGLFVDREEAEREISRTDPKPAKILNLPTPLDDIS